MVDDVLLHPELLQQTCTLQCLSSLHRNGFFTSVCLHFIFRHRIGGEVLHNFLLNRNINNFALSKIVDEIANIHWVPIPKLLNLFRLGPSMWGTTSTELSPSVGTSRSAAALPLGSHPPSWQGFQPSVWASEKSFPDWQKRYAFPEATWSSLLVWAMDVFSCAHKELSEPRWSCSYWWTSLKPLCCGSGCGCSCGYGLLLSQREHHNSQMLQMARAKNYLMTLFLLISCLN